MKPEKQSDSNQATRPARRRTSETTASRRLHPRFSVDIQVAVSSDNQSVSAHTRDISRSGLCLVATQALAREKEIGLELVLTFGEGRALGAAAHARQGRLVHGACSATSRSA